MPVHTFHSKACDSHVVLKLLMHQILGPACSFTHSNVYDACSCYAFQADAMFMSPPWGGPAYQQEGTIFDVNKLPGMPVGLGGLVAAAASSLRRAGTPASAKCAQQTIAVFLPRNSDLQQIAAAIPAGVKWEVERAVLNQRLKGITLYMWP